MWNWVSTLAELNREGRAVSVLTVTQCSGSTPREPGAKMLVLEDGRFFGTIGGGRLEQLAIRDAVQFLSEGISKAMRYPLGAKAGQCCGGTIEIMMESLNTGPALYLFGAGHVGQALCRVLAGTPFIVHVIDPRPEWVNSPELPAGVVRHACEWDEFIPKATWNATNTFVAIMTHQHDIDQQILERLIRDHPPTRQIGMIGSHSKWLRFKQRLITKGVKERDLNTIRCPIGLDTGGKAPQEIAISIAAELLAIHYGKSVSREKNSAD